MLIRPSAPMDSRSCICITARSAVLAQPPRMTPQAQPSRRVRVKYRLAYRRVPGAAEASQPSMVSLSWVPAYTTQLWG